MLVCMYRGNLVLISAVHFPNGACTAQLENIHLLRKVIENAVLFVDFL